MNASQLKAQVERRGTESHFFSRRNMAFGGDTMRNYGVRSATIKTAYDDLGNYVLHGVTAECWELYRKRPVKHGLRSSCYFHKVTFELVHPVP